MDDGRLTDGDGNTPGVAETRAAWRRKATELPWNALPPEDGRRSAEPE
jgi:hypothetical protein